jgi:DNA-binding response OmpR family regulator
MAKILIVEDEKMLIEMYRDRFIQEGFEVVLAHSAEEGIEVALKERPDLILLDILLPRKNGIGFLGELREHPEIASTKVVAFSNYDNLATKKEALELGAKAYLIKTNYTPQEIVTKVKSHLG